MNDHFEIKLDSDILLKYNSVQEYISYLYSQFNPIEEQSVKKLELTEIPILSEII